jgi:predicted nuclease of predicted toxin-antitoxin system
MKLLLDQNLSFRLVGSLADRFPGSTQVHLAGLTDASDRTIWDHAKANSFTLVTLDSDSLKWRRCLARRQKSFGCVVAINPMP